MARKEAMIAGVRFTMETAHVLDLTHEFPDGSKLSVAQIIDPGPFRKGRSDIEFGYSCQGGRCKYFKLYAHVDRDYRVIDSVGAAVLAAALVRTRQYWVEEDFYEVLEHSVPPEVAIPHPRMPGWSPAVDREWGELLQHNIAYAAYQRVWDDESHRQDGPAYYREWRENNRDFRYYSGR